MSCCPRCRSRNRQAFASASPEERARILKSFRHLDRASIVPQAAPLLIDSVEWLISTRELCQVVFELRDSPYFAINPELVDRSKWSLAGYKGGSEPGVLNYTHLLRKDAKGPVYAVSATINNPKAEVDTQEFTSLVSPGGTACYRLFRNPDTMAGTLRCPKTETHKYN